MIDSPAPRDHTPHQRVLLFDFDGVIADSLDAYYPVFVDACRELGVRGPMTLETFLDIFDTNAIQGLRRAGVPFYRLKKLGKTLAPRVAELNRRVAPFPGIAALINRLHEREPVYVITSNMTAPVEEFLDTHRIQVRGVVGADQEASKVKKIRRLAREHPDTRPWYIGDTRGDIVEARAAGAVTVAAAWGWHARERLLEERPDYLVEDAGVLAELLTATGGDHV